MTNPKFESILQGNCQDITLAQLTEFKNNGLGSVQLQFITQLTLFKINKQLCYRFLFYVEKHQITRTCFKDFIHQNSKIKIYNSLAGLNLGRAVRENNKQQMEKYMNDARKFLNSSQKVKMAVQKSIIVTRGYLLYYSGELVKATNLFNKEYEEAINNSMEDNEGRTNLVTCILGLAQTYFIRKNYHKALQLYKKALETNNNLPVKGRLGMAYCFYFLNKFELSEFCFKRILKIDESCIEAYIGLANLSEKKQQPQNYFKYLQQAYRRDPKHPLVILHLSQHYLFNDNYEKTLQFCKLGLQSIQSLPKFLKCQQKIRNDYEQYKARFNNILGQLHHIHGQYQQSMRYYLAAHQKGIPYNTVNLCQIYMHPNYQNYIQAMRFLQQLHQNYSNKMLAQTYKLMAYLKSKIPGKKLDQKSPSDYYKQALKYNKNDYQIYIEYASILSDLKKSKALELLLCAKKILEKSNKVVKVELLNNIAILYLQNNQLFNCKNLLQQCLQQLKFYPKSNQQQQLKRQSLILTCKYNLAITHQKLCQYEIAIHIYLQLLLRNKYYIDIYVRLANTYYQLGNVDQSLNILNKGLQIIQGTKGKHLRQDKLLNMKAHILHQIGSDSKAKEIVRSLGKNKDIYSQFYELCLDYETIMKKQTQLLVLKDFLRPKRQFCIKCCHDDPYGVFEYMVLTILLLADKKISKAQSLEFFTLMRDAQYQIPTILLNFGIFLFYYEDYQNSISILTRFRQRTGLKKGDQLISLIYLIEGKYDLSMQIIKKNILNDPRNLKYRFQLAYSMQKKCQGILNDKQKNISDMKLSYQLLKKCNHFYHYFSRINLNDILRNYQNLQFKDKLRNLYQRIKITSQQRKLYVRSKLQYYQKSQRQIQKKQKQQQQLRKQTLQKLKQARLKQNSLLQQLMDDQDDQQKLQKQKQQQRKKKLLAKMKQQQQQMNRNWQQMQQKKKITIQQKKMKRSNIKKPKRRQQNIIKQKQSSEDQDSFISQKKSSQQQQQTYKRHRKYQQQPKQKNKKIKKIKQQQQQQQEQQSLIQNVKQEEQNQQDHLNDDLQKYLIKDDQ